MFRHDAVRSFGRGADKSVILYVTAISNGAKRRHE